jgi:predicted membrane protein
MKTKKLIAAALAASMTMAALSTPASAVVVSRAVPGPTFGSGHPGVTIGPIFACAGGIILAAFAANYRDNRELTAAEAWSCGLLFWLSPPKRKHRH